MLNPFPLLLISTLLSNTAALSMGISPRRAPAQGSQPGGDGDPYFNNDLPRFKKEILDAHNARRKEFGVAPLTWDNELWKMAKSVTKTCVFKHSGGGYGENLYASSAGNPKAGVDAFADEVKSYRDDNLIWEGNSPKSKDGTQIGHYTQVAWKDTVKVACATSDQRCNFPGGQMWFLVCEYWPPGNVVSKQENLYIKNVGRPGQPFKEPSKDVKPVPPYKGNDIQLPEPLAKDPSDGSSGGGGGGGGGGGAGGSRNSSNHNHNHKPEEQKPPQNLSPSPSLPPSPSSPPQPQGPPQAVKTVTITVTRDPKPTST